MLTFPKVERYTLGEEIQNSALRFIRFLLLAANETGANRRTALLNASAELDLLKLLIRLSYEIEAIKEKGYITLQSHLQTIGTHLGGWLRSSKS